MPKAATSARTTAAATSPSAARPSLGRNQACLQCRKRKLKCDASRPHCGTCTKAWQATNSVPPPVGYLHQPGPTCSYDPVEGLAIAPEVDLHEKIRLLEEQIARLKHGAERAQRSGSRSTSPNNLDLPNGLLEMPYFQPPDVTGSMIRLPQASLLDPSPTLSHQEQYTGMPGYPKFGKLSPDPFQELHYLGWNADLPDPQVMYHLVDVFFRCDPCGSRILHRPSFMANLRLSPKDPNFPHIALLHAICASASRWTSHDVVPTPEGSHRDPFAEFHASKTRQYIDRTMATGADIFPVLQACILLSWYFYMDGRWVEVWIFAAFQTRVAIPLRLNYPGTYTTQGRNAPGAYLPPPKDIRELEARRRTWWMCILFDRIVSAGGWLHSVDERDMGTELPLRAEDFYTSPSGADDPCYQRSTPGNPQSVSTKNVLLIHPPSYTDSFILFLKSCLLFGKVTDYNVRNALDSTGVVSNNQDPLHLPGFKELDKLVCVDFIAKLPDAYTHDSGLGVGGAIDTDAYMLQVMPHAAAITLHTHYINFVDQNSLSTRRCINSAQCILEAYYKLSRTSLDISRLHPFVTICWYLAAVVQIHLCKYCIELGDIEQETTAWEEINILRYAMMDYGRRSPIGTRQEKLLQGMMADIVNMTTQCQPLQVGLPLYPFSHATVFARSGSTPSIEGDSPSHFAPLPSSPAFETTGPKAPAPQGQTPSPQMPAAAWSTAANAANFSHFPPPTMLGPNGPLAHA